jgi:hypothetical protein
MRLDHISSEAGSGANDPDAAKRDVPDRLHPSAATKQDAAFKPHRLGPSDSDLPAVLGKTSMSRSGLASPVKLEKTVSANRLGAWAYGAVNLPVQHSGMPRSQPSDAVSQVRKENSARDEKMIRPRENLAPAAAGIRETGTPGARSSLLARLVGQWQQADKEASRPAPVPDLAPPQADALPLPSAPSTAQWPLSAVSDMDFVRRLESVLLSESRRHGIIMEDQ